MAYIWTRIDCNDECEKVFSKVSILYVVAVMYIFIYSLVSMYTRGSQSSVEKITFLN